jgi:hypothetical protein
VDEFPGAGLLFSVAHERRTKGAVKSRRSMRTAAIRVLNELAGPYIRITEVCKHILWSLEHEARLKEFLTRQAELNAALDRHTRPS